MMEAQVVLTPFDGDGGDEDAHAEYERAPPPPSPPPLDLTVEVEVIDTTPLAAAFISDGMMDLFASTGVLRRNALRVHFERMRQDYLDWRGFYIKHARALSTMLTAHTRSAWEKWKRVCPVARRHQQQQPTAESETVVHLADLKGSEHLLTGRISI